MTAPTSAPKSAWGSLRLRLILGAALWVGIALTLAGVVLHQLFASFIEGQMVQRLETDLDQLAGRLTVDEDGTLTLDRPLGDALFQRPLSGLYWQVDDPDGAVLRSRSIWDGEIRALGAGRPFGGGLEVFDGRGPDDGPLLIVARSVSHPDLDVPLRLMVARDTAFLDAPLGGFARVLAVSLGVLAAGLIAAAWAQVSFGLRPLARLRAAMVDIRAGRTGALAGTWPREVRPLVDDLNALLTHNAAMVEAAQVQAGNLAHALKTPLSVIGNEAQGLVSHPAHPESGALIAQQVEAMRRHIDHHLARARAQAANEGRGHQAEVGPSLERLARALERLHQGRGVGIDATVAAGLPPVRADRQTVEELLGNLMEMPANGPPGGCGCGRWGPVPWLW